LARTRILGLLMACTLLGSQTLHAAVSERNSESAPYRPDYRYSGPQSSQISEDEAKGKDPIMATVFAVAPGIVIHGFGNYYAEDYDFGNRMLAMQIFGSGLAVWGYSLMHNPNSWERYFGGADNTQQAGYWVKAAGVGFMVLSWIGDIATASEAAQQFNRDHQINFRLESRLDTSPKLALAMDF
jgi:hypothetical protein